MAPDAGTAAAPNPEPMAVYRALRQRGLLQPDPAQQLAIERLQSLYRALLHYRPELACAAGSPASALPRTAAVTRRSGFISAVRWVAANRC